MDYVCGPIILYSQDKIRMMDFLSDVFEFDVDVKNDTVKSGVFCFKLVEINDLTKDDFKSSGIIFAFTLKNPEELKEILNKYNFFLYRKTAKKESEQDCQLIQKEDGESLSIRDIDGRIWRFECENFL